MKSTDQPKQGSSDAPHGDSAPRKTPNADMQAEDAGAASSETDSATDSGTAASKAMKQTSKTAAETRR